METKFVIQRKDGLYYQGLGWTEKPLDARKFDTKAEAEQRLILRPEWSVVEIDVTYKTENLVRIVIVFLLMLFASTVSAQTFTEFSTIPGTKPVSNPSGNLIGSGSLRGNGVTDIAFVQGNNVCVLLGNNDGTFQTPACFPSGLNLAGIALTDFNQDGHLDIVAAGPTASSGQIGVTIFFGDGTGHVSSSNSVTGLPGAIGAFYGPFVAPFNNDGKPEIAIAVDQNCGTQTSSSTTVEIIGNTGTFSTYIRNGACGQFVGVYGNGLLGSRLSYDSFSNTYSDADIFTVSGGFQNFSACGMFSGLSRVDSDGAYTLGFGLPGNQFCIQQPPSATILAQDTAPGNYTPTGIIPVAISSNQGFVVLSSSPMSLGFIYGTDLLHLAQSGTIINTVVPPAQGIAGMFTQSGLEGFAVLNQNGITIFLQGTLVGTVAPSSLTFGPVNLGVKTSAQIVTVTNTGTAPLATIAISLSGSPDFAQINNCPALLPVNSACQVSITYQPGTIETGSSAVLSVISNGSTQTTALSGTETAIAVPSLSRSAINFGNQIVGTSAVQAVTLSNIGTAPLTISNIVSSGTFTETNTCPGSVAPGSNCSISISFAPTAVGPASGQVGLVYGNAPSQQISLTGTGGIVPSIATPPSNQSVVLGSPVSFTVAVNGTGPLAYVWTKNSVAIGNSSTLTFTPVAADNQASIVCTVSNGFGTAATSPVVLTVNFVPSITSPVTNQSVILGQTATFSVTATGTAPLAYSWTKNGAPIGGANASYTTPATVASDNSAVYVVTVSNSFGTATSTGILTINFPPTIQTQPTSQTVVFGSPVTFSVTVSGTGTLSYQWSKNSSAISGAIAASYTFTPAVTDNGAAFSVAITSPFGTVTSAPATLTVLTVPVIQTQPASTAVTLGQTATFNVVAQGSAPLSYQWSKSGTPVGSNSPTYTTAATIAGDNGALVNVTVTNAAGHVQSSNAILTVNFPSSITQQPTNQTVLAGQTVTFSVVATGTNLSYQWQRNTVNISGAINSTYSFSTAGSDDGATFRVIVSDPFGPSVTSNTVSLTVNTPASVLPGGTMTVGVNQTTTLTAQASGTAPLSYQWSKTGIAIAGATAASYMTPALQAADDRTVFTVIVTNLYGTASANFTTNVILPPVITALNSNVTVNVGQTASFGVSATANDGAAIAYQWQKNGVIIAGAIGVSYTTPPATAADNGTQFTVVVSDLGGSVTSNPILLTVNSPASPVFTLSMPPTVSVKAGSAALYTLQVNVQNSNTSVSLNCTTTVPGGACNLSTNLSNTGQVTVTVTTPVTAVVPIQFNWPILLLILAGAMAFVTRPRYRVLVPVLGSAVIALALIGCGAAGGTMTQSPPPPPPANNTYTVTVNGTLAGAVPQSVTSNLVVTH